MGDSGAIFYVWFFRERFGAIVIPDIFIESGIWSCELSFATT
jgi:hypothetical protein